MFSIARIDFYNFKCEYMIQNHIAGKSKLVVYHFFYHVSL